MSNIDGKILSDAIRKHLKEYRESTDYVESPIEKLVKYLSENPSLDGRLVLVQYGSQRDFYLEVKGLPIGEVSAEMKSTPLFFKTSPCKLSKILDFIRHFVPSLELESGSSVWFNNQNVWLLERELLEKREKGIGSVTWCFGIPPEFAPL